MIGSLGEWRAKLLSGQFSFLFEYSFWGGQRWVHKGTWVPEYPARRTADIRGGRSREAGGLFHASVASLVAIEFSIGS
jgi:hypothetical protein